MWGFAPIPRIGRAGGAICSGIAKFASDSPRAREGQREAEDLLAAQILEQTRIRVSRVT
jgi:hypothetical protein